MGGATSRSGDAAPASLRRVPSAAEAVALRRQREAAIDGVRRRVRAAGWRWARSLETVLDALLRAAAAPTVDELHERVRRGAPRFRLPVLRHSLEVLRQHGVVREITDRRGATRYLFIGGGGAPATPQVVAVRCRACGRREDVTSAMLVRLKQELWRRLGYALEDPVVELTGVCPSCR